jgi:hypothetical protein
MIRKQIYITHEQDQALSERARLPGRTQSELIREALDLITFSQQRAARNKVIESVAGLWKDRADLPDIEMLRDEYERRLNENESR